MAKRTAILISCLLLTAMVAGAATHAFVKSACAIGTFHLSSGGNYRGNGQAQIDSTEVSIHLFLTAADGRQIRVDATDLPRQGNYFQGAAAIDGKKGVVFGRLDLARTSRLSASFSTTDAKPIAGRFIGTFPNDPVNTEWTSVFGE